MEFWNAFLGYLIATLMITLNSWEIHILRKTRKKHVYEIILLSLSTCDLIGGLFGFILVVIDTVHTFSKNCKLEYISSLSWFVWSIVKICWGWVSILHLICLTLDRFWAVVAPLHHMVNASKKTFFVTIALSWIIPISIVAVFVAMTLLKQMPFEKMLHYLEGTYGFSVSSKVVLAADFIFIVSYASIIRVVVVSKSSTNQHRHRKQSMKTLVLCVGTVLVFIFAKAPYVVVHLVHWNPPSWLYKVAIIMFPLDHILNSFIYLIQYYRRKPTAPT